MNEQNLSKSDKSLLACKICGDKSKRRFLAEFLVMHAKISSERQFAIITILMIVSKIAL